MAYAASTSSGKQLNFKVYLDSKEIGFHRVIITPTAEGEKVSVEANFAVKFFFITAFSYLHTAEEHWKNECLESIATSTTENGDETYVHSKPIDDGLTITTNKSQVPLTGCIRSFAYWDYQRLDSKRLLNTQTGQHVPASFKFLGEDLYENEGSSIVAKQYVLDAENTEINLWYSSAGEWLSLKTKVKGDRELAYHRVMGSQFTHGMEQ